MQEVVNVEVAKEDFEKFASAVFCTPNERAEHIENENKIIEQIQYGFISIEDDGSPIVKLKAPIGDRTEVKVSTRMSVKQAMSTQNAKTEIEQTIQLIARVSDIQNSKIAQDLSMADVRIFGLFMPYFL